ncbi:hypothetical protein A9Q74_05660 [Colwellia sp. 39_35_sub15_T18]|nr:hypothetical protein A9Q74_05660 [Colwellia sp. 39_35_sub15_T18]
MSSVPKNKIELQKAITLAFDKVLADYLSIPAEMSRKIGVTGNVKGTEISVNDTIAYLIGWGELVIKWYALKSKGEPVNFPETGYKWNELGQLVQSFHSQYHQWTYEKLLMEFKVTIANILLLVESLDNKKLYDESWYEHYTLAKMIQFNTSSAMINMRAKVIKFKKINHIK